MSNDSGKAAQAQAAPSSKLNPFAREFKLNVKAPSFTPVSKPAQPQSSAAPAGRAGQGPGTASAPPLPPSQHSSGPGPGYTFAPKPLPPAPPAFAPNEPPPIPYLFLCAVASRVLLCCALGSHVLSSAATLS